MTNKEMVTMKKPDTPTGLVAYDEEPVFTGDTLVFGGKH